MHSLVQVKNSYVAVVAMLPVTLVVKNIETRASSKFLMTILNKMEGEKSCIILQRQLLALLLQTQKVDSITAATLLVQLQHFWSQIRQSIWVQLVTWLQPSSNTPDSWFPNHGLWLSNSHSSNATEYILHQKDGGWRYRMAKSSLSLKSHGVWNQEVSELVILVNAKLLSARLLTPGV